MNKNESKLTRLMILVVFAVFALCILAVLLTGARGYEALVTRGEIAFQRRSAARYLTTRVHQADRIHGLAVEEFDGCSALVLEEDIDGTSYLTRVYCHDGYLRELFSARKGSFSAVDGEKLLPLTEVTFSRQGQALTATLTFPDGHRQSLIWQLRSGEEIP